MSKDGYEMDYDALENAITGKTKAVIPVDLGGVPCDYERIFEIVEKKKAMFHPTNGLQEAIGRVAVIADSAHAFGAKKLIGRSWKMCGAIADFTSFSFHAVKNLTTAEGGALTWKKIEGIEDAWIYHQFMLLSLHGQSKDALAKNGLGTWEYDIAFPGYKWNMTDIMGAIGLKQFERYTDIMKIRRRIIERYDKAFCPMGIRVLNHFSKGQMSSGHLYLTRIPGIKEAERNQIISRLAKEGVASNVHYKPLPMMTAYRKLGFDIKDYPNAYHQYENEITLPLHTCLKNEDIEYIITKVVEVIRRVGELDHAV